MAIIDSLSSYYKMDETAGAVMDDAHGTNDGTIGTGITINQAEAVIDKAYLFGGEAAAPHLSAPCDTQAGSFSIQFWIYMTGGDSISRRVFDFVGGNSLTITPEGTGFPLWIYGGGGSSWNTGWQPSTSTWYHCVYVMDTAGTDTEYLYIGGSEEATNEDTRTITSTSFQLGSESSYNRNFGGNMDEIGIWSRALSAAEVLELFNGGAGLAYPFAAAGTNIEINIADAWVDVDSIEININDAWVTVDSAEVNIGDAWQTIF